METLHFGKKKKKTTNFSKSLNMVFFMIIFFKKNALFIFIFLEKTKQSTDKKIDVVTWVVLFKHF